MGMQTRGMATEQQLRQRIKSITNTRKITSAMKMVAVCKLRSAQDRLEIARVFSKDVGEFFPESEPKEDSKILVAGVTGDKGLCGAVNSTIIRALRDKVPNLPKGSEVQIVAWGDKVRQGMERLFPSNLLEAFYESGKLKPATFTQIGLLADAQIAAEYDYSSIFYQYFRSMISYDTTEVKGTSFAIASKDLAETFSKYEIEGDPDTLQNLHEYSIACNLHRFVVENEASTLSSRMAAMESSSKNAGDMISKLELRLNRQRQARITTELTEIISGAAAVEEG